MDTLIAELEAATEGSRESDAEIWWDVKPSQARTAYWNGAIGKPHPLIDLPRSGLGYHGVCVSTPHYTTSLDAALTLVPEECGWYVDDAGEVAVFEGKRDDNNAGALIIGNCHRAPTPALALCIAALRARQAIKENG